MEQAQLEAIAKKVAEALEMAGRPEAEMASITADPYTPPRVAADDAALAPYIDHTLLKPAATGPQILELCREALEHRFASVCINAGYLPEAKAILGGTGISLCTVIGFPLGATTPAAKAAETSNAIALGAHEVDMVINVGRLKNQEYRSVFEDILAVVNAADGRTVKVIIETFLLTDEEKVAACLLSKAAGADFVKTSTGFNGGGATAEDIALMRRTVGPEMGVKASGGVRDAAAVRAMIAHGATRLGTSSGVAIVGGGKGAGGY